MNERLARILLPVAATILLLFAWQYGVVWFDVPTYLVPTPDAVFDELKVGLVTERVLWPHIGVTVLEIVTGYVAGCVAALVAAALISQVRLLEWTFYPLVAGIQSIPKVALAPIIMVWFGFEIESKIILVALICFFPTFVNAVSGLRGYDPNLVDLYRAFGAGAWRIFWAVKLPSALGSIFSGLEISVVLALIGAVLAELLSSRRGLGHIIAASGANFNVATMFACSLLLAAVGIVLTQIVRRTRRRLAFWEGRAEAASAAIR